MRAVDFNKNIDYFSSLLKLTKTKSALTGISLFLNPVPSLHSTAQTHMHLQPTRTDWLKAA